MNAKRALDLRCPACGGDALKWVMGLDGPLACRACGSAFNAEDQVLDLAPELTEPASWAQWAMQWPPLVGVYESRLWRQSPALAALFGISFQAEAQRIAAALALEGGERVLDIACGTGNYTRFLARRAARGRVVGLDLSKPMLAHAAAAAWEEGFANIGWLRASALSLPFAEAELDAINCAAALHLFTDPEKALAEMARTLKPGGRLALAVLRRPPGPWPSGLGAAVRAAGVSPFTEQSLQESLIAHGFEAEAPAHERGLWLIQGARRPPSGTVV